MECLKPSTRKREALPYTRVNPFLMKKPRVTQKDIANHLDVHRTTVSLALNNHPGLPETTRTRVRQAAEDLGYSPDPMLSALAAYRNQKRPPSYHGKLAWLINSSDGYDWKRIPHFVDYFKGATEAALKKGYQLETFDLNTPKVSPRRMAGILRARSISGILVPPLPHPQMNVTFPWKHFSAVSFGHTLATPRLHTVAVGHYRSTRRLLRELRERISPYRHCAQPRA
jgi:DNA-binding LacI/PurR family transcriptional regulator